MKGKIGVKNSMIKNNYQSHSTKAGLVFPIGRITTLLRKGLYANRISEKASISMAALLEYLTSEILENSIDFTKQKKKKRIIPIYIRNSFLKDEVLSFLIKEKMGLISLEDARLKKKKKYHYQNTQKNK